MSYDIFETKKCQYGIFDTKTTVRFLLISC